MKEELAEILEKTADKFRSGWHGWTQETGSRRREDGGEDRCMMMALDRTDVETYGNSAHYQEMYFLLHDKIQGSPVGWNDDPSRTKEEVIDLLESVAKDLRNQA